MWLVAVGYLRTIGIGRSNLLVLPGFAISMLNPRIIICADMLSVVSFALLETAAGNSAADLRLVIG